MSSVTINGKIEQMTRKKTKPRVASEAWLRRLHSALSRIKYAAEMGAEAAGKRDGDLIDPRYKLLGGSRDRACRARVDEVYFEILDTVGRAAEAAAARAAGYDTWSAFEEATKKRRYT